jgi:uncharacterized protein YdhG (YjbR/CyaY superfamily)
MKGELMESGKTTYTTIDEYIRSFPKDIQRILVELRKVIKAAAPESVESISYRMPAFSFKGPLVYFAAYKNHIGFYPIPGGVKAFEKELAAYKKGKGSVQFPIDKPLPLKLISKIVKFRVAENIKKHQVKLRNQEK